ncbi:MAG TPA: transglutaminase domain-containing protein [Bacteroidia bacterium]|jgi:transglutaminase-like putative cysteine protease|nr:transglutaminase domain-containing protein [Bacteroidia bacterium]
MIRLLLFLLFPIGVFSQSLAELKAFDYRQADSIALHLPKRKYKTVPEIAAALTENLKTEHEKFRAIFRWITDNIEYNKSAQSITDATKVVRKNKAVCQGFSNLLKEMCNTVNIPCDVIAGYTKTEVKDINKTLKKTDHAWNSVQLYGTWYLVDVTWATSKYNVVSHKYMKEFDEHYFITTPQKFILDHFPENKKFQFLDKPLKKSTFIKWPVYYTDYFHFNIDNLSLQKGTFKWHVKDTLKVYVTTNTTLKNASVLVNEDKFVSPVDLKYDERLKQYYFNYLFPQAVKSDFTVYLNEQCIAEYLINVKK